MPVLHQPTAEVGSPVAGRPGVWLPLVGGAWLLLLAAIFVTPGLIASPSRGEDLVRNTIRLSLLCYAAAAGLLLSLTPGEWAARGKRVRLARWCWTLAWAAYLVHLYMAFAHYHGWSHRHALEHTRTVSGVGEGIYLSHLFTVAWTADVVYWWLRPGDYARRRAWVGLLLHGLMAFVVFNATVVYGQGLIRWVGLCLFALLAWVWACHRRVSLSAIG